MFEAKHTDQTSAFVRRIFRRSPRRRSLLRLARCVALSLVYMAVTAELALAAGTVPRGTWLMDEKVAIQIFDCGSMLCGQVAWLKAPFDPQGLPKHDGLNPDPAMRWRGLCRQTIIWNLHSADHDRWEGGWFYNPNDGLTYRLTIELRSADMVVARIYLGYPIFGVTRTLVRIPEGTSFGWC